MKITKGQKYLCVSKPERYNFTVGKVYKAKDDNVLIGNVGWVFDGYISEHFKEISECKWVIKRTPQNARDLDNWSGRSITPTKEVIYVFSDKTYLALTSEKDFKVGINTEISFDTFKEIVGIEEEKKIEVGSYISDTMNVGYNVCYQVVSVNGDTLEYIKEGKSVFVHKDDVWILPYPPYSQPYLKEQPTEEWQPKWVSVNENVPETLELVYIVLDNGNQFTGKRYSNGWSAFYADGEKSVSPDVVTHWMPLLPNPVTTEIPMSEALEIIAQAKGINKEQIKIV